MLKALEVFGFKSFADRTRFEFPPGITVVVGPNGSGKSNIVDAIKWVLGEQSARSLRGKEMADVIFKGSGNGLRKPAATAEATIVFDNATALFALDAPEIHVTRRVYRSGEGEYLLNGQPCRLKDIKQLFRGTGVGTDAYSLIEQGKVDTLLQASPKDRRAIFEEAAGISRFNAKKIEAERRLDRVEQNLIRLADIVEEVDGRLRKLKSQASKARRYKEYSDRLQQLRTQVALVDWRQSSSHLQAVSDEMLRVDQLLTETLQLVESYRLQLDRLESSSADFESSIVTCREEHSRVREQTLTLQALVDQKRPRLGELDEEAEQLRNQIKEFQQKATASPHQVAQVNIAVERASDYLVTLHHNVAAIEAQHNVNSTTRVELRTRLDSLQQELRQQTQEGSKWQQQQTAQAAVFDGAAAEVERGTLRCAEYAQALAEVEIELQRVTAALASADDSSSQLQRALHEHQQQSELQESRKTDAEQRWTHLVKRQIALSERSGFLREIELRREGIGQGVQVLLERAQQESHGPFACIQGIVADILQVTSREFADQVAAALGDRAEHLVVSDMTLSRYLEENVLDLPGRVGIVLQHTMPPPEWMRPVNLDGCAGVLGRADSFVETTEPNQNLVQWLLSDTWFVDDLALGIRLSRDMTAPVRFVTRRGEVVERDGRLLLGPPGELGGVISRRAELRELDAQLEEIQGRLIAAERVSQEIEQESLSVRDSLRILIDKQNSLNLERGNLQSLVKGALQRRAELSRRHAEEDAEYAAAVARRESATVALCEAESYLVGIRDSIAMVEMRLSDAIRELQDLDQALSSSTIELTNAKVELAAQEQQFDGLRQHQANLQRELATYSREIEEFERQRRRSLDRKEQIELEILNASSEIEKLALQQSQLAVALETHVRERDESQRAAQGLRAAAAEATQGERTHQHRKHELELVTERLRHERDGLALRIREDYGIDLAELEQTPSADELAARNEVDQEILDLRHKLTNLGAVNMDALLELDELDQRYQSLHGQYQDLVQARDSLLKIIQRINTDSRRLFSETLEHVRANFQVLFRKVFGGGRADIVLEEGVDILEAGIDVVATPPGKHSLGLSLLSGGERALTAVTLLMAIFQYRPSPFCVLDEVDGPLDEANIGRFVDVLKEFLQWTKFVVVTHSKRTMTAAHTLYGVTMQESGVSKRVSVRFEDVNEKGEIRLEAVERANQTGDERGAA